MADIRVRDADNVVLETGLTGTLVAGAGETVYNETFLFIPSHDDATWQRDGVNLYSIADLDNAPENDSHPANINLYFDNGIIPDVPRVAQIGEIGVGTGSLTFRHASNLLTKSFTMNSLQSAFSWGDGVTSSFVAAQVAQSFIGTLGGGNFNFFRASTAITQIFSFIGGVSQSIILAATGVTVNLGALTEFFIARAGIGTVFQVSVTEIIHSLTSRFIETGADDNIVIEKTDGASEWTINAGRVGFFDNWLLFKNENEVDNYSIAFRNDGTIRTQDGVAGAPAYGFDDNSNTGMYLGGTDDTLGFSNGGIPRLNIEPDGTLNTGTTANYETLVTADDDIPNKKYVDDTIAAVDPFSVFQHESSEDLPEQTTTATTPQLAHSQTYTPNVTGTYLVTWSGGHRNTANDAGVDTVRS